MSMSEQALQQPKISILRCLEGFEADLHSQSGWSGGGNMHQASECRSDSLPAGVYFDVDPPHTGGALGLTEA